MYVEYLEFWSQKKYFGPQIVSIRELTLSPMGRASGTVIARTLNFCYFSYNKVKQMLKKDLLNYLPPPIQTPKEVYPDEFFLKISYIREHP